MKIAVVGLGQVGLPLAAVLAHLDEVEVVFGIDRDEETAVRRFLDAATSQEPGLAEMVESAESNGMLTPGTYRSCAQANMVIICVQTPVNKSQQPCYSDLIRALDSVGQNIVEGTLVTVESTLAPGTMENLVVPVLEGASGLRDGSSLLVAHCPERISPGSTLHDLCHNPRVIGGTTRVATVMAAGVYGKLGARLHHTDAATAEVVKTAENAYRDVQIAFANELAQICMSHDVDVWDVRRLVNTCPGRDVHKPSVGVGGPCIPKDPWLLTHGVDRHLVMLIRNARLVNVQAVIRATEYIENLVHSPGRLRFLILGVAYKADASDTRNSPSLSLGSLLEEGHNGMVTVCYHDPHVIGHNGDLEFCFRGKDMAIYAVDHTAYSDLDWASLGTLMRNKIVVNLCERDISLPAGFAYHKLYSPGKGV